MKYALQETDLNEDFDWVKQNLISVGYGPTVPIYNDDRTLNKEKSRRVEFRVIMDAQEQLFKILGGDLPDRFRKVLMTKEERQKELKKLQRTMDVDLKIRK